MQEATVAVEHGGTVELGWQVGEDAEIEWAVTEVERDGRKTQALLLRISVPDDDGERRHVSLEFISPTSVAKVATGMGILLGSMILGSDTMMIGFTRAARSHNETMSKYLRKNGMPQELLEILQDMAENNEHADSPPKKRDPFKRKDDEDKTNEQAGGRVPGD